jgi:hypothetical protein
MVLKMLAETSKGASPGPLTEDEWNILQAAHSLKNAIENDDGLELARAFDLLKIDYANASRSGDSSDLRDVVALDQLTKILPAVKLVYWFDDREAQRALMELKRLGRRSDERSEALRAELHRVIKERRLSPGIYCPDLKTAVIVASLFGDSFRICPKCRKVFFATKIYCSPRCEGSHRVARWRARKETRKGGQ